MEFQLKTQIKLPESVFDVRFHPSSDQDLIAAASIDGNVYLIENGSVKTKLIKHHKGSSIRKVRFTKDGKLVSIAKTVKLHDLTSNQTTHTLRRDDGKATTLYSLRPFGNNIISAGDDDGGLFVWDSRTPTAPIFSSNDCEQYISDIDGKYESRKLIICTSGEGTLTAYDMRAKKMIEPQSELFEAGFQCLTIVDANKKVVIGGEDGAIYVFNQNEWAHTSGKFAISSDVQNRGKCSIDCIDKLLDDSTFIVGCSDGKMRSLTLWPHQLLTETTFCKRSPLESIHVNPINGKSNMVICGENYVDIINCEEKIEEEDDKESDASSVMNESGSADRNDKNEASIPSSDVKSSAHDDPSSTDLKTSKRYSLNCSKMPQADIESSSLIMSVVRILTNNRDDRDRVAIKEKLEACLKASDEKLTNLVADNHDELKSVMQNFKRISTNLQTSLTKLQQSKQRLKDCQERLTSKIEELRRLSEESKKNEKIITLLDQVDELFLVPTKLNELVTNQQYLEATSLLVEKQEYIREMCDSFDCLKDLASELDEKREEMYRNLREKLFLVDDEAVKKEIVESLRMIDKTPEMPYVEEKVEPIETSKPSLFKFSLSSHAMCFNEHYKEQLLLK